MTRKFTLYAALCAALFFGGNALQAQDLTHLPEAPAASAVPTVKADSTLAPAMLKTPKVGYSLSAGAAFSSFGSASYIEPKVQYHVTPRFSVFSSLMVVQAWGGPTLASRNRDGNASLRDAMADPSSRQYLLHVGGSYAMTEKLLLSGSVWKSIGPSTPAGYMANPFTFGSYPQQGFNFQAKYQLAPNVTISGGVRYGSGNTGYWGAPGAFYGPGSAFGSPF